MESVVGRPVGVSRGLDAAVVRLWDRSGEVVGSGFLVEAGHVVTCAHVVARALGWNAQQAPVETDTVPLDFPLVAAGVMVGARVLVWHPVQDDDRGDIAVLALVGEIPAGCYPTALVIADNLWAHPFRTFGFPRHHDHGVWASGVLRARQAAGWVQMEGSPSGYSVEAGFSGAAVWDDEVAGVVGMTVAADTQGDLRAAYLIPADVLIQAWPRLAVRTLPPCPYRGLYPFCERDVGIFFGRQDLTDRLVREVTRRPLVAVVGPSGSGKSSVVFAGLVPQMLHEEGRMSISMRPAQASSPLFALAAALLPVLDPDQGETNRLAALGQLAALLRDGRLPEVIERILVRANMAHVLLVVDQFEELFTREGHDATEFVEVLLSALRAGRGISQKSLTVVVTLRADFLEQALQNPALATALEGAVTTIGQMGRDQLRSVIEGPLPVGVSYEAGLVDRILGDVGEETGSLPLLEFALTLLWERQDQGKLTHAAYEQLGRVDGALASYAERVYVEQLQPEDQEQVRRLLIQLVRPSDIGEPVRRVARRPELDESRWQLGQRLAATRLLVADRDPTGVESVELVHEALISGWSRLHEWVEEDRAFRIWQERLRGAAAEWETARRDPGALLRGAPLAGAERWLVERPDDISASEQQFIQASCTLRDRSVRRLRGAVATLTLLLVLAVSLGGTAVWASHRATNQARLAESRALVTRANSLVDTQPDVALLLAAAAYKVKDTAEAIQALTTMASQHPHADRLLVTPEEIYSPIVFSPTDPDVIALGGANSIKLWDIKENSLIKQHETGYPTTPTFSPDGQFLAFIQYNESGEGVLAMWSYTDDRIQEISRVGPDAYSSITFSPDGELLGACAGQSIQLWTLSPPAPLHSISLDHGCAFGFTDGGRDIAYFDGAEIVTWDISEERVIARNRPPPPPSSYPSDGQIYSFSFAVTPDGRTAIYESDAGELSWWDLDRQVSLPETVGYVSSSPVDISFTPDSRLATVGIDGGVLVVDVARRMPLAIYSLGSDPSGRLGSDSSGRLSADGRFVAAAAEGGIIALAETGAHDGGQVPVRATHLAVRPDSEHLTAVSPAGDVAIHSLGSPEPIFSIPPVYDRDTEQILNALSPNGLHYAYATVGGSARQIRLRDISSPPPPEIVLEGHRGEVRQLSFDPRSNFLASADLSQVIVWSAKDRAMVSRIQLPEGYMTEDLAVDPEGRYVATNSSDGKALLWDTTSNNPTSTPLPVEGTTSLTFSSDGKLLGIGNQNEIRLWRIDTGQIDPRRFPVVTPKAIQFSPDGTLLAASHQALTGTRYTNEVEVTVWNVRNTQTEGTISVFSNTSEATFSFTPDNARIAVAGHGVGPFDAPWALRHVCQITDRNLTREEWNQYASGFDYITTCP